MIIILKFVFRIKDYREEKGLTQEELAEKAGVKLLYIQEIEEHRYDDTKISKIYPVAKVLKKHIDELCYECNNKNYDIIRAEMHENIDKYGVNDEHTKYLSELLDVMLNKIT